MKESTLCRAYTVKEDSQYGRTLTIRETSQPETIIVELHNSGADGEMRQTQSVWISREDWYALMRVTREYGGDFNWAPEPIQPPTQESTID